MFRLPEPGTFLDGVSPGEWIAERSLKTENCGPLVRYVTGQVVIERHFEPPPIEDNRWSAWAHLTYVDNAHRLASVVFLKLGPGMSTTGFSEGQWVAYGIVRAGWYGPIVEYPHPAAHWDVPGWIKQLVEEE
jgi:hypothetical protein